MTTNHQSSILRGSVFVLFCAWIGIAVARPATTPVLPFGLENRDSAAILTDRVNALRASGQNPRRLAESYLDLSRWERHSGHLDSAVACARQALDIYMSVSDLPAAAHTLLYLGEVFSLQSDYLSAMNNVYSALDIYESREDDRGIARCYTQISDLLYYSNEYDEGLEYGRKAIAIQRRLGLNRDLAASYYAKSCAELFMDDRLDSALASINVSLAIHREMGERGQPYLKALNWRGNVYKFMQRYGEALADYRSTLKSATAQNIVHYILTSYANIGHVYLLQERYAEALPHHLKAIDLMKRTGDTRNMWENCMHAALCYEQLGQPDSALKYQKAYIAAYEDYMQSVVDRLETETQAKYETRRKNETINAQARDLAQQARFEKLYFSVALLLLTVLALLSYGYYKRRSRNRVLRGLNAELSAKNRQNELLMKEVHHRVKNNLEMVKSLLALQSAKLRDPAGKEAMIASQNRVQSMGIVHRKLYAGNELDSIEMKDYFESLGEEILSGYRAGDRVALRCEMEPVRLDVDTALPIGLIVNELISNSLKYAFPDGGRGCIVVALHRRGDGLELTVSDDGVGMNPKASPQGTGFGSQLIELLTRQLNGVLCHENDRGTTVKFLFHPRKAA